MSSNVRDNVVFADPRTADERSEVAGTCVRKLGLEIPAVIDDIQNTTETAYTAWPDRLYVIGSDGKVVYKSAPGPFGFNPQGVEDTLRRFALK